MEYADYIKSLLGLIFVLGLILLIAWAARRYGLGMATVRTGSRRRLAVIESTTVDAKRRLVLVRRDGREHLLLVGGGSDLVIEKNIQAESGHTATPEGEHT